MVVIAFNNFKDLLEFIHVCLFLVNKKSIGFNLSVIIFSTHGKKICLVKALEVTIVQCIFIVENNIKRR